jgi:hypothetical protein
MSLPATKTMSFHPKECDCDQEECMAKHQDEWVVVEQGEGFTNVNIHLDQEAAMDDLTNKR